MASPPQYQVLLTPPGGAQQDVTAHFDQDQWTVTETFGRTGTQGKFYLQDEIENGGSPSLYIPPMSLLEINDLAAGNVFAGVIVKPRWWYRGPTLITWDCNATDYSLYAMNAIVHGDFLGWTGDEIVIWLTQQANCGIKAAPVSKGGFVAPGPQLQFIRINYAQLTSAWNTVSKQASLGASYGWFIDDQMNLHWYSQEQAVASGVSLTDMATAPGTLTTGNIRVDSQLAYYWDGSNLRTRCLVRGATMNHTPGTPAKSPPTEAWEGNGHTATFNLSYSITSTSISIILLENGVAKTVGVAGESSGAYLLAQSPVSGSFYLQRVAGPLPDGAVLQAWYPYQAAITAQADSPFAQSQYAGPNGGVFTMYVADTALTTASAAFGRGVRELQEYSLVQEMLECAITEDFPGVIHAGDVLTVSLSRVPNSVAGGALGFTAPFIVTNVQLTGQQGGYRRYLLQMVRIG